MSKLFKGKVGLSKELQGLPTSFLKCGECRLLVCNLCVVHGWHNVIKALHDVPMTAIASLMTSGITILRCLMHSMVKQGSFIIDFGHCYDHKQPAALQAWLVNQKLMHDLVSCCYYDWVCDGNQINSNSLTNHNKYILHRL